MSSGPLHIIDQGSPCAEPIALRSIAHVMQRAGGHALLLGGRRIGLAARAAGLSRWTRLDLPPHRPWLRLSALRGALQRCPSFETMYCWSPRAQTIARWLAPHAPYIIQSPEPVRELSAAPAWREAIRRQWDVSHDRQLAVVLLTDDPARGNAYEAAMAIGLCREALLPRWAGLVLRLIVQPDQHARAAGQRMLANLGQGEALVQDDRIATPWQVVSAADAALVAADSPLSLACADAGGTPAVQQRAGEDLRSITHRLTQVLQNRLSPPVSSSQ